MILSNINLGSGPDVGDGEPIRSAFAKVNNNFSVVSQTITNLSGGGVTSVAGRTGNVRLNVNDITGLASYITAEVGDAVVSSNVSSLITQVESLNQEVISISANVSAQNDLILSTDANVYQANLGMKGYVDSVSTAWISNASTQSDLFIGVNANISQANLGMKGYVDAISTAWTANANTQQGVINTLSANAATQSDLIIGINANVSQANLGMKGYVDAVTTAWTANASTQQGLINTLSSNAATQSDLIIGINANVSQANLGMKGYVDSVTTAWTANANTQQGLINTLSSNAATQSDLIIGINANVSQANLGMKGYVDAVTTAWTANASTQQGLINTLTANAATQNDLIIGINANVSQANLGIKGYVDEQISANISTISNAPVFNNGATVSGNLIVNGNLILNGSSTLLNTNNLIINDNIIYLANTNPSNSLDIGFAGHFTSNGTYQHTGLVRQATSNTWKLFSNISAEPGTTLDFTNAIYDNLQVGNITSPTITAILANAATQSDLIISVNANVSQANLGMKGYVDAVTTAWTSNASTQSDLIIGINANVSQANLGMKGYVDAVTTAWTANASTQSDLIIGINANVSQANLGMKGYVDAVTTAWTANANTQQGLINTLSSNAATQSDLIIGINANVSQANLGMKGYVDAVTTAWTANANTQQGLINNLQSSAYSNVNLAAYLAGNVTVGNITAAYFTGNGSMLTGLPAGYSNVQVATYLPTYTGNLSSGGYLGIAGQDGSTVVDFQTGAGSNQIITLSSNYVFSIKAGAGASNRGSLVLESGQNSRVKINGNGSNVLITAGNGTQSSTWIFSNTGVLSFPDGTTMSTAASGSSNYSNTNVAAYLTSQNITSYSNVQVATYLPTYTGNIANIRLGSSGVLTFADGTTMTTAASGSGGSNYSNVNVAAYLNTQGYNLYSNVNVIAYLGANPQPGTYANTNVAAYLTSQNISSYSNVQVSTYLPTYTGNISANNFIGTTPNVQLIAGSYTSTFDNTGNVALPNLYVSGNLIANYILGNGAFLTGIVSSGGGSNYSNVNVAAYLNTQGYNIYSNVNVAAYLTVNPIASLTSNTRSVTLDTTGQLNLPQTTQGGILAGWLTSSGNLGLNANGNLWRFGADGTMTSPYSVKITTTGIQFSDGTAQSTSYSNVQVISYLNTQGYNLYSNANVAVYLTTYSGNLSAGNITVTSNISAVNVVGNTIGIHYGNIIGSNGNVFITGNLTAGLTTGYTAVPNSVGQFTGNANTYVQFNQQNISTGTQSSTEFVATANNGTDTTYFIDMGIAGSNYLNTNPYNGLGTIILPNDSYLYAQGNLSTTTGGNLAIGATTSGKAVRIFAGGNGSTNIVANIDASGVSVTGAVSATGNVTASNMVATGNVTASYIVTTGGYGNISQVNTITANSGIFSSNVNVGNVIASGSAYFAGPFDESSALSGVFLGNTGTSGGLTPRIGFYNGVTSQNWEIDNYYGTFRWFTPGNSRMTLDPGGNLTVYGTGGITTPNRPAFRVVGNGGQVTAVANITSSNWTLDYQQGTGLNSTTGVFTAPVAGLYSIHLVTRTSSNTNNTIIQTAVLKNNANIMLMIEYGGNTSMNHTGSSTIAKLAVGDTLTAKVLVGSISFDGNDNYSVAYIG